MRGRIPSGAWKDVFGRRDGRIYLEKMVGAGIVLREVERIRQKRGGRALRDLAGAVREKSFDRALEDVREFSKQELLDIMDEISHDLAEEIVVEYSAQSCSSSPWRRRAGR